MGRGFNLSRSPRDVRETLYYIVLEDKSGKETITFVMHRFNKDIGKDSQAPGAHLSVQLIFLSVCLHLIDKQMSAESLLVSERYQSVDTKVTNMLWEY